MGIDEVMEVPADLCVAIVVIVFDGGVLDGPVHPFPLSVRPRMIDLGEPALDAVLAAAHSEHVGDVASVRTVSVARGKAELDAIVGQDRVDLVREGRDQGDQERRGGHPVGAFHQLHEGDFARPINGDKQNQLAFSRLDLSDVDVEEADGVGLEPLLRLLLAHDLRQPANAMPLQASVQRRARQMRDCRL